jgi:hypothetical protein
MEAKSKSLTLKPADKTDLAAQQRRLWKVEAYNRLPESTRNALTADVSTMDPELAAGLLEVGQQFANILPSSLQQLHEHALRQQHGDAVFAELENLSTGIKIAEDTIAAVREDVSLDVGGIAKLNEAAAPYERIAESVWLKKFADGEVRAFSVRNGRGYWDVATAEQIERGRNYPNAEAWRAAQASIGVTPEPFRHTMGGTVEASQKHNLFETEGAKPNGGAA